MKTRRIIEYKLARLYSGDDNLLFGAQMRFLKADVMESQGFIAVKSRLDHKAWGYYPLRWRDR